MAYSVKASESAKINLAPATLVEEVLQNLAMIIQTAAKSVPLYRDFGTSATYLDKPTPAAETLIVSEIYEAVEKYEPRAEIQNISFETDAKTGKLSPCLEVEINVE